MRPSTMRFCSIAVCVLSSVSLVLPVSAMRTRRGPTSGKSSQRVSRTPKRKAEVVSHPRAIDDARAAQIQTALVRAGYLSSDPSGHWDSSSEAAMQKLQADNGWQTKMIPDSRALIKLGLGPQSARVSSASFSSASSPSASSPSASKMAAAPSAGSQ